MAERQVLFDSVFVRRMDRGGARKAAAALGVLGLEEMTLSCARSQYFAAGSDFEPLGGGLLGFDALGTTHKSVLLSKKSRDYTWLQTIQQGIFAGIFKLLPRRRARHSVAG